MTAPASHDPRPIAMPSRGRDGADETLRYRRQNAGDFLVAVALYAFVVLLCWPA